MGIAVAREEALQPYRVGAGRRTDEYRATSTRFDQGYAAEDERAHHALAEFGFGDQQRAQAVGWNENRFDVRLGNAVGQSWLARKLPDFGEEFAGSQLDDGNDVPQSVAPADGNSA